LGHAFDGQVGDGAVMDGIVIVEAGKQQLQQVFADLANGPFGWHFMRVAVVQTADLLVKRKAVWGRSDAVTYA
jgi:hypothetical protein